MANKVLELLWTIAHDQHLPNEIIDQALAAHLKILDYSCFLVNLLMIFFFASNIRFVGKRKNEISLD